MTNVHIHTHIQLGVKIKNYKQGRINTSHKSSKLEKIFLSSIATRNPLF